MRILVADDNEDACEAMASVLRHELGCAVFTAYDGQRALRLALACRVHAVILDIRMPRMGGLEVARAFRLSGSSGRRPLLLAVTGVPEVMHDLAAIDGNFDRAFAKPVRIDDLLSTLTQHWAGQSQRAQRTRFELFEVFTRAAREALPAMRSQRQALSFDCVGPRLVIQDIETSILSAFYRVLHALVDVMGPGFLIVTARAEPAAAGRWRIELNAGGAGDQVSPANTDDVLLRLGISDEPPADGDPPGARRASGSCPNSGGRVTFTSLRSEGLLFRLELDCTPVQVIDEAVDARGALAWIINPREVHAAALKHRLQRLGWNVERFDELADARERLATPAPPALLVLIEDDGLPFAADGATIDPPAETQVVRLVAKGSHTLADPHTKRGDVRIEPLSPRELVELTERAVGGPESAATGAEKGLRNRLRVLIVDDNDVNRVVASGMVEALGYETSAVADGLDAVERCKVAPPALLLIDVNMPVLNGIDATRRIRDLQRRGRIPPFAIVAATADSSPEISAACLEAGADGVLVKPLHLSTLRQELLRVTAASFT